MKKIFSGLVLTSLSLFLLQPVHAETKVVNKELSKEDIKNLEQYEKTKPPTTLSLSLTEESYQNGSISRKYIDSTGNPIFYSIPLPKTLSKKVEDSTTKEKDEQTKKDKQLVEAKKQLTASYMILDSKEKLQQLNNEKLYESYQKATLSVSNEYQAKFQEQLTISKTYGEEKVKEYNALSKKKKETYYSKDEQKSLQDYSKMTQPTEKQFKESIKKSQEELRKKQKNEKKDNNYLIPIIISVLVIVLLLISFFIYKKKRSKK